MELSFFQGRQFQIDSASKYSSNPSSQTDLQKKSTKKLMSYGSGGVGVSSRKRIRRQNSIQESVTNYFKENKTKVASFLDINSEVIHLIHPINLIFPQPFKILEDGLYILIRGGIKMITFNDEKPPYRSMCRQITNNAFRMMKNNKDLGMKVLENGTVIYGKQLQKKNYYRNNSRGKNQVEHSIYTVTKAFSVIQCVNQNCLNISPQTILYRIQQDDAKQFNFKQKKEELYSLIKKNSHLIKTHSMLHHYIETKIYNFRNFIEFDNVAIIKKGFVKVTKKEKFNTDFIKQSIQYQKIVCQLGEGSLLIPKFYYEVASSEVQIIQIDLNDSFKFIKLPEWVSAFILQQQNQKNQPLQNICSKLNIQKKSLKKIENEQRVLCNKNLIIKKPKQGKTKSLKQSNPSLQNSYTTTPVKCIPNMPSLLSPLFTSTSSTSHFLKQKFWDYLPNNQKLRKIKFKFQKQKKAEAANSINLAYQIVDNESAKNNPNHANGQINNKRTKQKLFFKAMSPYIIISEKIGIKQMLQTQKILKKKPKYQDQDDQHDIKKSKLKKFRSIQYCQTRQVNERKSWQGRNIQKMTRYLSKENQDQYQKQYKQNLKKLIQGHKKSYSQMSTFYGDSVLNKCRQRGIFKQISKLNFSKK